MKALFLGRFQPFHKGHLQVVKECLSRFQKVFIGIGSSQYEHTLENPFNVEERRHMIEKTLEDEHITSYKIFIIPDIHNYPHWVAHVEQLVPIFDVVVANNDLTMQLFREKGYEIYQPRIYSREVYCGREIRRRMINDEPWRDFVPDAVYRYLVDIKASQRMKELGSRP
jgi:nicotinamide-nucleotide adenylyltransferase